LLFNVKWAVFHDKSKFTNSNITTYSDMSPATIERGVMWVCYLCNIFVIGLRQYYSEIECKENYRSLEVYSSMCKKGQCQKYYTSWSEEAGSVYGF
jgi:hypothetical protein